MRLTLRAGSQAAMTDATRPIAIGPTMPETSMMSGGFRCCVRLSRNGWKARPARSPAAVPVTHATSPSISASASTERASCPGVAPVAASNPSSRCRRRIDTAKAADAKRAQRAAGKAEAARWAELDRLTAELAGRTTELTHAVLAAAGYHRHRGCWRRRRRKTLTTEGDMGRKTKKNSPVVPPGTYPDHRCPRGNLRRLAQQAAAGDVWAPAEIEQILVQFPYVLDEVGTLAQQAERVLADGDRHVQVAGRATARAVLALPLDRDPLPGVDPGGDLDLQAALLAHPPLAAAGRAGL